MENTENSTPAEEVKAEDVQAQEDAAPDIAEQILAALAPAVYTVPESGFVFQTPSGRVLLSVRADDTETRLDLYDPTGSHALSLAATSGFSSVILAHEGKLAVNLVGGFAGGSLVLNDYEGETAVTVDAVSGVQTPGVPISASPATKTMLN